MTLNKQKKPNSRGIEWTDYTWPLFGGCFHDCQWMMPDGEIAPCYAGSTAETIAQAAYPEGFQHHYYRPENLEDPLRVKTPSRIFVDSMADMFGHWVPEDQIEQAFDVMRRASWHTFQSLTKNAPRLLKFTDRFPENLWIGVSSPPSFMFGKELSPSQQSRMFVTSLGVLGTIRLRRDDLTTWLSLEPLAIDAGMFLRSYWVHSNYLPSWLVIGAASRYPETFQPDPVFVDNVHGFADQHRIPVFHKGNLQWSPHREEFPATKRLNQGELF